MQPAAHLARGNIATLEEGIRLVERLDAGRYTWRSEACPEASVGSHFRHCLDFYTSFLDGLAAARVDYESRPREVAIETLPETAIERSREVLVRLETLAGADPDRPLLVRGGDWPDEGEQAWARSTVKRELQFLLSHTIHHYALIGTMLRLQGFRPDATFGVAPSTLRHWGKIGRCAS